MQTPYGEAPALFTAGRAPFMIDGDWRAGAFLTDESTGEALIPPEKQKDIVMTVFPAIPGEINHGTSSIVRRCWLCHECTGKNRVLRKKKPPGV